MKSTIRINCAKRCGIYLKQEVEALGYEILESNDASVQITGTLTDCMRLNLYLKTAYRVLFLLDEFTAQDPDELYRRLIEIPWEDYILPRGYISISSYVENEYIKDTRFANLKVKDAIVDRMLNRTNSRPDSGPETDKMVLYLYWKDADAAIFIDTSGDTIAKHGYRMRTVKAPMQESLAASLIMATKWDQKTAFINPMCGSGTLAIEAAMMAIGKPPGLMHQNFGFCYIKGYDEDAWLAMRREAIQKTTRNVRFPIIATDWDAQAIAAAKLNAKTAGVDQFIRFEVCKFEDTRVPENQPGVIMLNPAYGARLGEEEELEKTYAQIGDFFKKSCAGYTGYVFTGNIDLAKHIHLKTSRRIEFFNAKIDCRLLEYEMYEGTKTIGKEEIE